MASKTTKTFAFILAICTVVYIALHLHEAAQFQSVQTPRRRSLPVDSLVAKESPSSGVNLRNRDERNVHFSETQRRSSCLNRSEVCLLKRHVLNSYIQDSKSLGDVLEVVAKQSVCKGVPVFLSMASVGGSNLYWQLIENFIYSSVKFELIPCTVMICVSDNDCMTRCKDAHFPCYNFRYEQFHPVHIVNFSCLYLSYKTV